MEGGILLGVPNYQYPLCGCFDELIELSGWRTHVEIIIIAEITKVSVGILCRESIMIIRGSLKRGNHP